MDVPEEVMQQLGDIQSALDDVEEHLQPFLEAGPKEITAQLTPLERLKAHLGLAQAAVVLFQLDRQLDAAKLDKHPLQKELERLSKYERKVQEAVAADDLARTKPGASLNIAAANRFIDAAIPDLSLEQKAALRSLHKRPAAAAADAADADAAAEAAQGEEGGLSSAKRRSKVPRQQQQHDVKQQKTKQRTKSTAATPASAQDFIQELVAEVAQQEQQQEQQQQPPGQHSKDAGAGDQERQPETAAAAAVDADAFLQDVMAELDKQS